MDVHYYEELIIVFLNQATGGGRLKHGHFEMIRLTLGRKLNQETMFAIWRVDPPWQPVTKKVNGSRLRNVEYLHAQGIFHFYIIF